MKNYDVETLETSIQDFNDWTRAASLYFNKDERYFRTEVFHNDVHRAQTVFAENCVVVIGKSEIEGNMKIGEKRREYIEKFVELLDDGWDAWQIAYELAY